MKNQRLVLLLSFLLSVLPLLTSASGASLYLSPASSSFLVGSTFDVSIFVNTGKENINAIQVVLEFDPKKIQVASPTSGKSFIEVWVSQPTFSNTKGTLTFRGGIPTPGVNTSSGLVSTVTFRAIAPGETTIKFMDSSKVLRNDPNGTNILTSKARGVYSLTIPPPEGPKLYSSTHPDQNKWYKDNNPTFSWESEEGITDFSYSFDHEPSAVPDSISDGNYTSVSYSEAKDGIWYFHVKAKKDNIWGGASHYAVQIDASGPAGFEPLIEPENETTEKQPLVFFATTDALSGVSHFTIKYIDITKERQTEEESGFFQEAISPYKLPTLIPGKYLVVVRAYDISGNWREATAKLTIFPEGLFFSWQGIRFGKYFIPLWPLIVIFFVLIALIVFLRIRKIREKNRKKLVLLASLKRQLAETSQEIKTRIGNNGQ